MKNLFERLKAGLGKTRSNMVEKMDSLFSSHGRFDEAFYEELEDLLILSDVGYGPTLEIIEALRERIKRERPDSPEAAKTLLKTLLKEKISLEGSGAVELRDGLNILLVIGVNGVGKTTTIGKLATQFKLQGKQVLVAAGDTFRAAAVEQLKVWSERAGCGMISQKEGADSAAVVYDAIQSARARGTDVLICDTAGRLHNKKNLMNELEKITRIIGREAPDAALTTLLVLDATTGQNAKSQAKAFKEIADISGIVMTKLDGTAKGGILFGIAAELCLPVKYIGVGESREDLQAFDPETFLDALFQ